MTDLVSDNLPKILTIVTDALGQLVVAIVNNAPALLNALIDSLVGMVGACNDIAPDLITGVADLLQSVATKLFASIPLMSYLTASGLR